MSGILELVKNHPVQRFEPDETIISQGSVAGAMFVLLDGAVEVLRDNVRVAKAAQPGVVFGEMSILLKASHTATVKAFTPCSFAVVSNPREFLENSAQASLFLAELLANRLDALNKYLVDVKRQYEGHDHLSMVDGVLEALMHRQKK